MSELTLMVCPHDTVRNPEGWYHLVQYLATHFGLTIHFEMSLDFSDFHQGMSGADAVYANSADALRLIDEHGFGALARPAETYDEALIVCGPEGPPPDIGSIHGSTIASVTNLLPTRLALRLLRDRGISPGKVAHRDSWLSVVRSVWNGEAPFGILYRDAYSELSPQGKAMVRVLEATDMRAAFHMFLARPAIYPQLAPLARELASMAASPAGAAVLADLGFPGWAGVTDEEIAQMRALIAG